MRVMKRELKAEEKFYNKLKARLDQAYDPDFDADAQFEWNYIPFLHQAKLVMPRRRESSCLKFVL